MKIHVSQRPEESYRVTIWRSCGNPDCHVSFGVHEGLTFGSGRLDAWGYWEHPCPVCAREHERLQPADGKCWPFQDFELLDPVTKERKP